MYVYIIETSAMIGTQKGHIYNVYLSEEGAVRDFNRLREAASTPNNEVIDGVSEFDNEPGVLAGFWYGPKGGNTCSHGARLQRVWAYE